MSCNMSIKFVHSVKVPRIYKECASTVKKVLADGASFKTLVFKHNHPNVQGIYALVSETLHHCEELQSIIDKTKILIENPRFDPWLARVLITELLWGKKVIKSEAKPVLTVLNYKEKLQQALVQNHDAAVDPCDKKRVKLPRYVRVNTLLTSIDETLNAFIEDGWRLLPQCGSYTSHLKIISNMGCDDFIQDFHIPEVFIFPPGTQFHNHPGYLNGKLLLQDKASCLPAFLLNPTPNSEIMDMCSAPGMKTTQLASIISNKGKIYAIEMNYNRYKTLCEFVTHANATCVEPIQADALTISSEQYPNIEYILVDPSCSGSGMVDRIEIRKEDQTNLYNRLGKLQSLQSMILNHALNFPNIKRIVYSTCSIYPEENECVVDEAMIKFGDIYDLVDVKKELNNEWINFGSSEYSYYGDKCLYARPDVDNCSGFFLAVFTRKQLSEKQENSQQISDDHDVQFNQPKKTKKQKKDHTATIDYSNGYNDADVKNVESEENKKIQEVDLKKKKKRKMRLEGKATAHEHQFQHEVNIKSDGNLEIEVIEVKKKKKKKQKTDDEDIKYCPDNMFVHNNIEESTETLELKVKKKKKNEKKIVDPCINQSENEQIIKPEEGLEIKVKKSKKKEQKTDEEEIKDCPYNSKFVYNDIYNLEESSETQELKVKKKKNEQKIVDPLGTNQSGNEQIVKPEEVLEIKVKKRKKKEEKTGEEKIKNLSYNTSLNCEENMEVLEVITKKKKKKIKENETGSVEILFEVINESDKAKSKKRKKNKNKEDEHHIEVLETPNKALLKKSEDNCSNLVKKKKKKNKKDKIT